MKITLRYFIASLLICLASTGFGQSAASLKRGILKYTNEYRASNGLGSLQLSDVAGNLAQKHSADMAAKRTGFGHGGFQDRTNKLKQAYGRSIATGENVAYGNISAREVVNIWIHSSPHRKNLLGNFNKMGIGVAEDRSGTLFFTQLFLRN